MKKILALILAAALSLTLLAACGAKPDPEETETEEVITEELDTEESTEEAEEQQKSEAQIDTSTYRGVLEANRQAIEDAAGQKDIEGKQSDKRVLLYDLNGDGVKELIFIAKHDRGGDELHIFTMKDGKAVECDYDVDDLQDGTHVYGEIPCAFAVIHAGGPSGWMLYSGKNPGVFYAARYNSGSMLNSYSLRYSMDADVTVRCEKYVHNKYAQDPSLDTDEYDINGSKVNAKEGQREFKAQRDDYDDLLMYGTDEGLSDTGFKVFDKLKTDTPLAGSLDDILSQLD